MAPNYAVRQGWPQLSQLPHLAVTTQQEELSLHLRFCLFRKPGCHDGLRHEGGPVGTQASTETKAFQSSLGENVYIWSDGRRHVNAWLSGNEGGFISINYFHSEASGLEFS